MHPYYDRTRTHWHSETLTSFSWLSLAHTLAPIQRFELAGARHGAGAAPQPQGALAAHSQAVPPSRLRATPWLGATPPSQRPRGPPRRRRTSHDACSAALCNRARPLARATPAADEEGRGGARTTSGVVRRTFALGASSFWRTWRPHAHHFSADSLFHGLPMCSVFRSKPKSHKHHKKFVSSLHSLALAFFF